MNLFVETLKSEIERSLPGTEAQLEMAPQDRLLMNFPRAPGPGTRVAAVLILLFPKESSVSTIFMQRPDYEGIHAGQISFPGGMKEPSDENLVNTALRETFEEVGVDKSEITLIGTLTPLFIPVSDILVTPAVGWANVKPEFRLQKEEVVYLIEGNLKELLNPSIIKIRQLEVRGEMRYIKYFDYNGHVIWGATAMMLNELLTIIRDSNISLDVQG